MARGVDVDGGQPGTVGLFDDRIGRDHQHLLVGKGFSNAPFVIVVGHLVRGDDDSALTSVASDGDCSRRNIHRSRGRLDHDDRSVDRGVFEAGKRADARFEIGNDHNTIGWNGAEQLLSG